MLPLTMQPSTPSRGLSGGTSPASRIIFSPSSAEDVFTKTPLESPSPASSQVWFGHNTESEIQALKDFAEKLDHVWKRQLQDVRQLNPKAGESSGLHRYIATFLMDGKIYQLDARRSAALLDMSIHSVETPSIRNSKLYLHITSNYFLQFLDKTQSPSLSIDTPPDNRAHAEILGKVMHLSERLLPPEWEPLGDMTPQWRP